jgi:hypothetical protein
MSIGEGEAMQERTPSKWAGKIKIKGGAGMSEAAADHRFSRLLVGFHGRFTRTDVDFAMGLTGWKT